MHDDSNEDETSIKPPSGHIISRENILMPGGMVSQGKAPVYPQKLNEIAINIVDQEDYGSPKGSNLDDISVSSPVASS